MMTRVRSTFGAVCLAAGGGPVYLRWRSRAGTGIESVSELPVFIQHISLRICKMVMDRQCNGECLTKVDRMDTICII